MSNGEQQDLHVVTDNGEQCFMWRSNQLTYIGQDRQELPHVLATKFGPLATRLDLSYNSLTRFENISLFTNLSELILDNNQFKDDDLEFKQNLRLKTLSLNKNKSGSNQHTQLSNLYKLIRAVKLNFPNLEYLSLIGNPLNPMPMTSASSSAQQDNNDQSRQSSSDAHQKSELGASLALSAQRHRELSIDELVLSDATNGRHWIIAGNELELDERNYRQFIIHHLPNLRFLDSVPVTAGERDEALRRCFWIGGHHQALGQQQSSENLRSLNFAHAELPHSSNSTFKLSIMCGGEESYSGEPAASSTAEQWTMATPKGVFSKLAYKYTGKNSEGNRFIRNHDL